MIQHYTSVIDDDLVKTIISGGIGVMPTDTVYGLVAKAGNQAAIEKLYSVKRRANLPGTLIAASIDDLIKLGFSELELRKAANFWPGATSVVIDAANIPLFLKQTRTSLAVRIPDHPLIQQLLAQTGPLMTTSANQPDEPTSTTIAEAQNYFGDAVDFYVDGGVIDGDHPSKIVGFDAGGNLVTYRD